MRGTLAAGWLAASGMATTGTVQIIAATAGNPATVGDLISAGGSVSAAGALIYIVKKMTDGQLVARDPSRVEAQLVDLVEHNGRLVEESQKREERLHQVIGAVLAPKEQQNR